MGSCHLLILAHTTIVLSTRTVAGIASTVGGTTTTMIVVSHSSACTITNYYTYRISTYYCSWVNTKQPLASTVTSTIRLIWCWMLPSHNVVVVTLPGSKWIVYTQGIWHVLQISIYDSIQLVVVLRLYLWLLYHKSAFCITVLLHRLVLPHLLCRPLYMLHSHMLLVLLQPNVPFNVPLFPSRQVYAGVDGFMPSSNSAHTTTDYLTGTVAG